MSLAGKVYAVTGGASGIGLSTAKLLSTRGATVCIADISDASLATAEAHFASLAEQTSPTATAPSYSVRKVDVTQRSEVDAWIEGIVSQFGRLDGAANIAGVIAAHHEGQTGTLANLEDEEWERIIGVNLTGCMYCLRAELRVIRDGGSIVNMASIQGVNALPYCAAYGASKHGVVGLTRAAAKEVGAREIRVNAVAPGAIYTPLMQRAWDAAGRSPDAPFNETTAFQRQGKSEEVANVVCFLLGPESSFVSGSVYGADGAWL